MYSNKDIDVLSSDCKSIIGVTLCIVAVNFSELLTKKEKGKSKQLLKQGT